MVTAPRGPERTDPAGDVLAVVDAHGTVTGWSEGARLLTGYPAAEVTGRPVTALVDGDAAGIWRTLCADGGATVLLRHRDGRRAELTVRVCPVRGGWPAYVVTAVAAAPDAAECALVDAVFRQASMPMCVLDTEQRYLRTNEAASQVMEQPEAEVKHRYMQEIVTDPGFQRHLRMVVETGRPVHYESRTSAPSGRRMYAWNIEIWPVRDSAGELIGTALAAQDSSEQYLARQRLAILNEAADALGTRLDVAHTAEELAGLAVPRFADFAAVDLLDSVLRGEEPPPLGVVGGDAKLCRVAHQSLDAPAPGPVTELGAVESHPPTSPPARALATGGIVLARTGTADVDDWIEQRAAGHSGVNMNTWRDQDLSLMAVPLVARGTTLGVATFARMMRPEQPIAFDHDDVSLAQELASRAAVCVDNARRYTRERTTALALQRSLLPHALAGQVAVEFASRYLPALSQAGVGGDWFDVIPLSGTRVALVVGDVVGHGIHASVTMGRLRTAVWTLADVDLPPDELLTHLDDLVGHLATDATDENREAGEIAATCLYAVYDPVSRRCTVASAGHPPPVLRLPDGSVRVVEVSAGPMLGVGGLPFEATEIQLPEGSLLALYTDGLIEGRELDVDAGTRTLCAALAAPAESLDDLCDTVLRSCLPDRPGDDVALLIARTEGLDAERVAVWDMPADPAMVATARQHTIEQLARWGLAETAFVTELVVSELVTNAIRYGGAPIQLRLIRDSSLICEVSDASSTSPHLRRARTYDEGGRGLLLVAQLTDRWGTRPNGNGKTIWAEQVLPAD
ncbi:SpoIIE family protein phosphatase [Streptomyces sp. CRN 30]|uniref:SpoIIE family protein phosphatase n=1 Tax=Streptomyces sp. CRN 30 TaxID=3075613 RepID=UPI002A814F85|nr:SpoIIE family protein phosphatase [Streptomyces sp. CRN 30]